VRAPALFKLGGGLVLAAMLAASIAGCVEQSKQAPSTSETRTGTGGSLSRFAIVGDRLYALTDEALQLFDIADPAAPQPASRVELDFAVETLFPYQDYLFIGGSEGMYIYDNTDPAAPAFVSQFTHARACDPVVVQGNYAYITLRSAGCWGTQNLLEIVDLTDIKAPTLVNSVPLQAPRGLAVDGDKLFVCDDTAGLKTLSVADPKSVTQLDVVRDTQCYDVIATQNRLIVSATGGVLQYSYASPPLALLSSVPTTPAATTAR
jgi:hypothetical protein